MRAQCPDRRWERGHGFLEAVEVDLTIGLIHDSYRRWERGHRFLLWMKISCWLVWLAVPCWLSLNKFLLRWWHVACWSLNTHRFCSVSPDLSRRFAPAVGLCWSLDWSGVWLDEDEPDFIIVDLLIIEYLLEELIASWLLVLQASLFGSQWELTWMIG
jgi:hypothetical protein